MTYKIRSLTDIAAAFAVLAEELEQRASHAPQQREREILRTRAGVWREASRYVSETTWQAALAHGVGVNAASS